MRLIAEIQGSFVEIQGSFAVGYERACAEIHVTHSVHASCHNFCALAICIWCANSRLHMGVSAFCTIGGVVLNGTKERSIQTKIEKKEIFKEKSERKGSTIKHDVTRRTSHSQTSCHTTHLHSQTSCNTTHVTLTNIMSHDS